MFQLAKKGSLGVVTLLAALGLAVVGAGAAYAYTATGTLTGSGSGVISTIGCSADTFASAPNDKASTEEHSNNTCTSVTVKIYYTNSAGYAGWSSTVTHPSYAVKQLTGSDELVSSYHTAVS